MHKVSMNVNDRKYKHLFYSISIIVWDKIKTDTDAKILKRSQVFN